MNKHIDNLRFSATQSWNCCFKTEKYVWNCCFKAETYAFSQSSCSRIVTNV